MKNAPCGCCEGTEILTPLPTANRPGLSALRYRVGTHATFVETMKARLSSSDHPELKGLTTREADDPAIALLDAWATLADLLTFYQERIANEGYLLTATERRSILELARLVGYRLRPGVSASTFLAFTLEEGFEVEIPEGTRAQSLPGPGELPQPFESTEPLLARDVWSAISPRLGQPQVMTSATHTVYIEGLGVRLKPPAPVLVIASTEAGEPDPIFRRVYEVEPEPDHDRTKVRLVGELKLERLEELLGVTPVTIKRESPQNLEPADGETDVDYSAALTLTWEVTNPGESIAYDVHFGPAGNFVIITEEGGITDASHPPEDVASYPLPESKLEPDTTYYWAITARDGTSELNGPVWKLTTSPSADLTKSEGDDGGDDGNDDNDDNDDRPSLPEPDDQDETRAKAADALAERLKLEPPPGNSRLANPRLEELPETLKDLSQSTEKLEREIRVQLQPLFDAQRILHALSAIHPSARDYREVQEWVQYLEQALVNIIDQLPLRSTVRGTPGVPPEEQFIDPKAISALIDHRRLGEEELDGPSDGKTVRVVRSELQQLLADMKDFLGYLLDSDVRDEDKVVTVRAQALRVGDLAAVFREYWQAEKPILDWDWIDNLYDMLVDDTITDTPPRTTALPSLEPLLIPPSSPPASALRLERTIRQIFAPEADIGPRLLTTLQRQLQETFYQAWASTEVALLSPLQGVEVLRASATPFGARAPLKPVYDDTDDEVVVGHKEWGLLEISLKLSQQGDTSSLFGALPLIAEISLVWEAQTLLETVVLDESTHKIEFTLGDLPILAALEGDVDDTGQMHTPSGMSIDIAEEKVLGLSTTDGDTVQFTVDNGFSRELSPGDTVETTIHHRAVTIEYANDGLGFIIDHLSVPMPSALRSVLTLDAEYDQIATGSWVVIEWPDDQVRPDLGLGDINLNQLIRYVNSVRSISKAGYGQVTELELDKAWLSEKDWSFSSLRQASVYAQSERLPLAKAPIQADVAGSQIQLEGLYDGLEAGRWLIVSGERTDIPGTRGLRASELVMLAGVTHSVEPAIGTDGQGTGQDEEPSSPPADRTHTTLHLANELSYTYKRDTVSIYGNVVKATHGETRQEVLGSGDGSQSRQTFALKQSPLTYLAAPTPAGAESTLEVRVDDILWHEADNLIWLGTTDRGYITRTDNEDQTTVIFGDGQNGARLPTGIENIKAVYRTGIGRQGNVAAEQISLLATRPLGVKGVVNPLAASGGTNREGRDQARLNAPLAVMALDRLVSIQDYADFARTYAGIGKASAVHLSDGRQQVIHLTVAGVDDAPLDEHSDLYQNLGQALRQFGPPHQPVVVTPRELVLLIISADVRLLPDCLWEAVAPTIRIALLDAFSFERRQLGQDVLLSEVVSTMQGVPGIAYIDVDILDSVSEHIPPGELRDLAGELTQAKTRIQVEMGRVQTTHRVKRGNETLASVAQRYGITEVALRQLNPGIEQLEVGSILQIPRQIRPAQLAYLSPDVHDMLILRELT